MAFRCGVLLSDPPPLTDTLPPLSLRPCPCCLPTQPSLQFNRGRLGAAAEKRIT